MLLFIVRHGLAGQRGDPRWPDDSERPLTKEGRKRFRQTVRKLADRGFAPKLIATSPLVRCRQTAELILEELGDEATLVELDELRPGAELDPVLQWTNRQAPQDIAWVGHSPDVEALAAALIGAGEENLRFTKGAIAAIEFPSDVAAGAGQLRWLVTAKVLGC
jgi:phosphohistidine phosphatase